MIAKRKCIDVIRICILYRWSLKYFFNIPELRLAVKLKTTDSVMKGVSCQRYDYSCEKENKCE